MTVGDRNPLARLLRLWLPLGLSLIFTLFPFYWMAITSLKPNQELYSRKVMPLVVHNPTLKHYIDLFTETNFLEWTWNTFIVAVLSTAISLIFGAMLAYPLARIRFAGAALVSFAIAATYLVPQPLLFVPLADIINSLGLGEKPFPDGYDVLPKDRILNVQIKGKAVLDYPERMEWPPIFRALERDGYQGQLGLETHIFGEGQVAASHASMKEILRQVNLS